MALIALLVEGQTERIFLEYLLPCLQLPDRLFISKKLPDVLKNDIHENKIWLQDCTGDGSFPSYIKKNQSAFITNNFDKILLVRDYYPDNKPPTALCKGELCQNLINNIPGDVTNKYTNNILINLSVEEIEAWFFLDKKIFERIGVNPIDCTKCDRVLDRINTPRGEKGSCHEIQEVHSGI